MDLDSFECTTAMDVDSYQFEIKWNVQKPIFQDLIDENGLRESDHFYSEFHDSSWYLQLRKTAKYPDHFGIFLFLKKAEIDLTYSFRCLVKNGLKVLDHSTKYASAYRGGYKGWGWNDWIKKDELMLASNWTNDFLTIVVEVKVKAVKEVKSKENVSKKFKASDEQLTKDFGSLIQSGLYSDITLKVGEKKFKAHKGILAARCEYFATMFGSEFKEANENEIIIKDTAAEEFGHVLKFIYTGQFKPSANTAKLLVAADRFALARLVLECEKSLEENITIENCLESYQVADLCSRHNLKSIVLKFIKANIKSIKQTDTWKNLKTENMPLICNILESIFDD